MSAMSNEQIHAERRRATGRMLRAARVVAGLDVPMSAVALVELTHTLTVGARRDLAGDVLVMAYRDLDRIGYREDAERVLEWLRLEINERRAA